MEQQQQSTLAVTDNVSSATSLFGNEAGVVTSQTQAKKPSKEAEWGRWALSTHQPCNTMQPLPKIQIHQIPHQ